jgi:predicted nucleotidyltransferase
LESAVVNDHSYEVEAAKCLAGFQLLEHLLKQYIKLHHLTARHLLRGSIPFNFDGSDVANSSLEGLIGRLKKCTDDTDLVQRIKQIKSERDDLAHLAFAQTYLGLSAQEKALAISRYQSTKLSIQEICKEIESEITGVLVAPYKHAFEPWARNRPLVGRIWIFGSRSSGSHRIDSDLDVAIELDMIAASGLDDSDGLATWMFESTKWKSQLEELCGLDVDLQQYLGDKTPTIEDALAKSSALIYSK